MELTDENIKERTVNRPNRFYNKSAEYYQSCLNQKGYSLNNKE